MSVIYPGTFDPVTLSHHEIIKRAAKIFGKVIVAVAVDTTKNTLFSTEERLAMMQESVKMMKNNEQIEVILFDGLLVDFAKKHNVNVIVRGLRALSDFEYEFKMSYMNKKIAPNIETIFLPATEKENFISSSFVREIARLHGNVDEFVCEYVAIKLKEKFSQ